jgi:hypothetical protein
MQHQRSEPTRRPSWHELASRFSDERECLASFLALEAAEVLAGEKPANLINVANQRRACGRNLYLLWRRHGAALLQRSGLAVRELAGRGDSLLLFLYRPQALAALLARRNVAAFLRRAGYRDPADPQDSLAQLQGRLAGEGFPHEIGVFLGYPLKDVAGFMGWAPLPFTCQGPWKIYGDPQESLRLAETFRRCRCRMARQLAGCDTAIACLKVAGASSGDAFSSASTENEYHYKQRGLACVLR